MSFLKKNLFTIIMLALAIAIIVYISLHPEKFEWDKITQADYSMVAISSSFMLGAHFLRAFRWSMLTETSNYKLNTRRSFYSVLVGYLINAATSRGGEVVRCAMTAKSEKAPVETLIGTVITERIIDLVVLVFMCLLCLLVQFTQFWGYFQSYIWTPFTQHLWILALIPVVIVAIWIIYKKFIAKPEKSGEDSFLSRLLDGLKSVFLVNKPLWFIVCSFGIWIGYWISMYFQLKAFDSTVHLTLANALGVLIFSAIGVIIPIPGAMGVGLVISYGLTTIYAISASSAQTFGVFTVAFSNIFHISIGAICYVLLFLEIQKLSKQNVQSV